MGESSTAFRVTTSRPGGNGPQGRRRLRWAGNVSSDERGFGVPNEWMYWRGFGWCGHELTHSATQLISR